MVTPTLIGSAACVAEPKRSAAPTAAPRINDDRSAFGSLLVIEFLPFYAHEEQFDAGKSIDYRVSSEQQT
jgi:hypothetical protein